MCLLNVLSSNFNIVLSTKQATTNLVLVVDGRVRVTVENHSNQVSITL